MERFWDERAREDAFWFVDSRLDYGSPDVERFWADGAADLEQLLEMVGAEIRPGDTVVDIGCGLGRLSRAIAARAERVLAVDISEEMLQQARTYNAHLDNVTWIHGDGTSLAGVADGVADACVSHVVFQHIPDPQVTLGYVRDMGRVLKPGGWSLFQVSNDPDIHRPARQGVRGRVARLAGRKPRGLEEAPWLGSSIDLDELRATADGAGMDIERVEGEGTQYCIVRLRRRASKS
jgi:ubiquinone/menaquinone biosynthesis C-methylase UbiE